MLELLPQAAVLHPAAVAAEAAAAGAPAPPPPPMPPVLTQLTSLELRRPEFSGLDDAVADYGQLIPSLQQLRVTELQLHGASDPLLRHAVAQMTQLRRLLISDAGHWSQLSRGALLLALRPLSSLRHLHLRDCCSDSAVVAVLLSHLRTLEELVLEDTERALRREVISAVTRCALPSLRRVHLVLPTRHAQAAETELLKWLADHAAAAVVTSAGPGAASGDVKASPSAAEQHREFHLWWGCGDGPSRRFVAAPAAAQQAPSACVGRNAQTSALDLSTPPWVDLHLSQFNACRRFDGMKLPSRATNS